MTSYVFTEKAALLLANNPDIGVKRDALSPG